MAPRLYFAFDRRRGAGTPHPAAFTVRALGSPGTSKKTCTRRSPQFGHFNRDCNWSSKALLL
jgi:hypothetical protein